MENVRSRRKTPKYKRAQFSSFERFNSQKDLNRVIIYMELKSKILELRAKGLSYRQIEKELGCNRSLISYHVGDGCKKRRRDSLTKLRRDRKRHFIEQLGGKCSRCGYNKSIAALDFHHKNSNEKEIEIGDALRLSFKKAEKEIMKCVLVCANCHREIHEELDNQTI